MSTEKLSKRGSLQIQPRFEMAPADFNGESFSKPDPRSAKAARVCAEPEFFDERGCLWVAGGGWRREKAVKTRSFTRIQSVF
jgi:hypothetical protein